jgi:hypothetical protein
MKPSRTQWILCSTLVIASLLSLGLLQAGARADSEGPPLRIFRPPGPPPPSNVIEIPIRYRDFSGRPHSFTCWLDRSSVQHEEDSFGAPLDHEIVLGELDRRLAETLKRKAGNLSKFATLEVTHKPTAPENTYDPVIWDFDILARRWGEELPGKEPLPKELRTAATAFESELNDQRTSWAGEVYSSYYRERGFDYEKSSDGKSWRLEISYQTIADQARPPLGDCFEKLVREAGPEDGDQISWLMLAAFQDMEFELPKLENGNVYTAGLWTPMQVLTLGRGDCDSRATAFCALKQRNSPQVALLVELIPEEEKKAVPLEFQSDEHVLLAIESPASNVLPTVDFGGHRPYILCEVVRRFRSSTREKVPLGTHLFSGPVIRGVCMTDHCFATPDISIPFDLDGPGDHANASARTDSPQPVQTGAGRRRLGS